MKKKLTFAFAPIVLISILASCKNKGTSTSTLPPTSSSGSEAVISSLTSEAVASESVLSSEEILDDFVELEGGEKESAFYLMSDVIASVESYEGSHTTNYVGAEGEVGYMTYDSTSKKFLRVEKEGSSIYRDYIYNRDDDPVLGIRYSDTLKAEDETLETPTSYEFVNVSLDYGAFRGTTDMATIEELPPYQSIVNSIENKDLFARSQAFDISLEAGQDFGGKNPNIEFSIKRNAATDRYLFQLVMSLDLYSSADPSMATIMSISQEISVLTSSTLVYESKQKMFMTMGEMTNKMESFSVNKYEFDAETYNDFKFKVEEPDNIVSYNSVDLFAYYKGLRVGWLQEKPGTQITVDKVKENITSGFTGLKVEGLYYDEAFTKPFNGISSIYRNQNILYVKGSPKDGYIEVDEKFTTYDHTTEMELKKEFTDEEIEIIGSMSLVVIDSYSNSRPYFYSKTGLDAAPIVFTNSSSNIYYDHVFLGDSETEYTSATIPLSAENIFSVRLERHVYTNNNGLNEEKAFNLIDDWGNYDGEDYNSGQLIIDLGVMKSETTMYYKLDTSKYTFWGSEYHFYTTPNKADHVHTTGLSETTQIKLECYYYDGKTKKDLTIDSPDVLDVPSDVTVYFKVTALADLPMFSYLLLL